MMQIFLSLMTFALFFQLNAGDINWMTDYDKALQEANAQQKPLLLLFTKSDCPWCKKLDTESLSKPEFAQKTKNSFIFVLVNFPSKEYSDQNNELQKKFNVRGFPTLIILSPDQQQIGITGYRPGGGKEYAAHLIKIVQDYAGYQEKMSALKQNKLSGTDLKNLYELAKAYDFSHDQALIAESGLLSDEASYFMLEKFRNLSAANKLSEAQTLKNKLLEKFPNKETRYNLAVIEFEKLHHEMKLGQCSAESTIEPLLSYIKSYGNEDKENVWRLNMIVSQVLYDNNNYSEALKHAQQCYEGAPSAKRSDIAEVITDINAKKEHYR